MSAADPITTIADALAESPVYVDPRLATEVPEDVAADLVSTIDENDLPVYVVVYPVDYNDAYNGRPSQLLALVQEESGLEGTFAHVDNDGRVETYAPPGAEDEWEAATIASDEATPAEDLERFLELVISGEGQALLNEEMYGDESGSESDDGSAWPVIAIVAIVVVIGFVVAGLVRNARNKQAPAAVRRAFDVPAKVIEAVRKSQESTVAQQARERVLALGETLDATDVPTDAGALTDYRAALDAYDAASRTLDANDDHHHLADAVGALVLVETGQAHLERATGSARDRKRDMPRPCFFNPLHGASDHRVALPGNSGTKVPACADCARATKGGKQPQALVVTVDGTSMPYYESGLQPWADTGYGSLGNNLVERVLTRGIER